MSMTPEEAKAKKEALKKTAGNIGSFAGGMSGVISSTVDAYKTNSSMMDTSKIEDEIDDNSGQNLNYDDFDSLMSAYNSYNPSRTDYTGYGLRDKSVGSEILSTVGNTFNAALSGMSTTKSPYGALFGLAALGSGIAGSVVGMSNREDKAYDLNIAAERANDAYRRNFSNNAGNIRNSMFNKSALNIAAYGGNISPYVKSRLIMKSFKMKPRKMKYGGFGNYYAYGGDMTGDWSNGITLINNGGTHEQNPYSGVPFGVDANGTPNLVEEGEVVFNDYVFSNRRKPTKKQLSDVKLPEKYEGMTFAEIAKAIQTESENNPLDPISKNTLVDGMTKLMSIQEDMRRQKAIAKARKEISKMPDDELAQLINQSFGSPEMQNEQQAINIMNQNPRAYKGIREEMNKENLGESFAFGGYANFANDGLNLNRRWLPYDNSKGFVFYDDKTKKYDKGYLDWLDNIKFDTEEGKVLYDKLAKIYKDAIGKDLTPEEARRLGKDKKFGQFHTIYNNAYSNHIAPKYPELSIDDINIDDYYTPVNNYDLSGLLGETPIYVKTKDDKDDYPEINPLQYMPAIGSILQAVNKQRPDYSNSDLISKGRRGIRDVRGRTIGHYLAYNPYDINYEADKIRQTGLSTQRAMANTADNRGQVLASMALLNNNINGQYGDLRRKAMDYNDQQRKLVEDFNRQTDIQNAQFGMQADQANSSLDVNRAQLYENEAKLRDQIESAVSRSNSSNVSNALTNIGNIGKQIYEKDKLDFLLKRGWVPGIEAKCGGKIRRKKGLLR